MKPLAIALGTALCLAACARGAATSSPSASAVPSAASAPSRAPSATPVAHAPPVRVVKRAITADRAASAPRSVGRRSVAPAQPQILSASVYPTVVGSGAVVSATVRTTPGVVSVTAYAGGVSMPVPRTGPGVFSGSTTLPPFPSFVHGSYAVTFVAHDGRGVSTQSAVGVTVR